MSNVASPSTGELNITKKRVPNLLLTERGRTLSAFKKNNHYLFLLTKQRFKSVLGIRILYPQKDPCISNFLVIELSKIQFRPNNFFFL